MRVSDSRILEEEECSECEELIEKNFGIVIEIDEGYLVEIELEPKVMMKLEDEMGEDLGTGFKTVGLVLRSGKYIGPWASSEGLDLDEVKSLRRDLDW